MHEDIKRILDMSCFLNHNTDEEEGYEYEDTKKP